MGKDFEMISQGLSDKVLLFTFLNKLAVSQDDVTLAFLAERLNQTDLMLSPQLGV